MNIKKTIIIFLFILPLSVIAQQRIISLGPLATKELFQLGVGDSIIGDTTFCKIPEAAKSKTKIGSLVNINIEKIISLKPDIIFANGMNDKKQLAMLRKLGIKNIIQNTYPRSFDDMCSNFLKMGEAVDKKQKAEELIKVARKEVLSIRDKTKKLPKVKVFVQIGSDPLFAAVGGTFIDDFIDFAGGVNVAESHSQGIYSVEKVVEDKPDVIIVSLMGSESKKSINTWKKYDTIPAVKNKRICNIPSYELCSPDPINFPIVLKRITKLLHPEIRL